MGQISVIILCQMVACEGVIIIYMTIQIDLENKLGFQKYVSMGNLGKTNLSNRRNTT